MKTMKVRPLETTLLNEVPGKISDSEILTFLQTKDINWEYVKTIKELTDLNDDVISDWLNVSVRTFRSYKQPKNKFKENVKEQILLLLSLIHHGIQVFGSQKEFNLWLNTANFFFDNVNPISYLNTVTGIRFVDDRLTAMEYGDNV
ncbi:MAG: MbcA/ParS/Xre antitoxin family protein [Bacteroidetes bacterium]|nr:MbcA/ParS/Xre antitoxin family protein [Bacteroidota bacterium]